MAQFSDYIVFVDESGDHGMTVDYARALRSAGTQ